MKIDYNILWVEDDRSWYDTTLELFRGTLEEKGFELKSERKTSFQQVQDLILKDSLQKYDMLLIDFTLPNSSDGDKIIKLIRDSDIYTDVLFYSSAIENIRDSISKYGLEGVYTASRIDIEAKFISVFSTTIKKIQEVNSMRGLIMGETAELDVEIENLVMTLIEKYEKTESDLKPIIEEKEFNKLKEKVDKFWDKYSDFHNYFPKLDAIKKWEILRDLLKAQKPKFDKFLEINKTYQNEVISIRNIFAHAKAEENDKKMVLKGQFNKKDFEFDEAECIKIRQKLITHRNNIKSLKDSIGIKEMKEPIHPPPP